MNDFAIRVLLVTGVAILLGCGPKHESSSTAPGSSAAVSPPSTDTAFADWDLVFHVPVTTEFRGPAKEVLAATERGDHGFVLQLQNTGAPRSADAERADEEQFVAGNADASPTPVTKISFLGHDAYQMVWSMGRIRSFSIQMADGNCRYLVHVDLENDAAVPDAVKHVVSSITSTSGAPVHSKSCNP